MIFYVVNLTLKVDLLYKKCELDYDFWIRGVTYLHMVAAGELCCLSDNSGYRFSLGPRLNRRVPYSNHSVLLSVRPSVLLSVRPSVLLSVCPSKNFNIGHNFFTFKDKSFIFGMCDPYDKTFPTVPWILNLWPWPWPLTYFWKTLTLAITFLLKEIGLSYLACVYLMTRPFRRNHKFWACDLDCDLWPTFEKL